MYSLNIPVSQIRTKTRQEFERHRYVQQLQTVDVLLQQSNAEFQVRLIRDKGGSRWAESRGRMGQWRQGVCGACWLILALRIAGDTQLLEAAVARSEVLQGRGGAQAQAAEQLHYRVPGGRSIQAGGKIALLGRNKAAR